MPAHQADYWKGRVVLITGAGSGIGQATALEFARAGAQLVLLGRKEAPLAETAALVEELGAPKALVISGCDVSNNDDMGSALKKVESAFGRLDAAFNNAGVAQKAPAATAELDATEWNRVLDINLRGVFLSMKHELPLLEKTGGGAIVNTASCAGKVGFAGYAAYCASKFGVIGLTKTAALDYAQKKIFINAICPGPVETPLIEEFTGHQKAVMDAILQTVPERSVAKPAQIASMVFQMCAPWNSYMTGAAVSVDGGQTAGYAG
ncbi:SDR family oxidoreductase [Formicincola oecophyllae]|uniref:SDR family oxidoreductase n=2 Tax=Formicincola oecophyllae TaxID=2558361 RepID=A0A4Y6UAH0_9PROT|nr:SDR family oxidoreductase [Formicincola oecophyllae]